MHTRFIHILLFSMVAGWLMASCTSNAPSDENLGSGVDMQFAVSDASRSSASETMNYAGSQFAVFGDMRFVDSPSSECAVIFNGVLVSYEDSQWTYSNTRYWFPKHEHSFVAFHPATVAGVSGTTYSGNSLSFDYTLPEAFGYTPDLLVATHRRMYEGGATPTVMLRFVHALSRVNFLAKCDGAGEKVIVKEVRFEKVRKSGTMTVKPAPLASGSKQTDDYNLSWTGSRKDETLAADIEVEVEDGSELPLFPDNDALFVIPQPDNDGIIVKITYTVFYKNGGSEERTVAAAEPIDGWKPGKFYTYSLSFEADIKEIDVNVSVNDWKYAPAIDDVQVPRK